MAFDAGNAVSRSLKMMDQFYVSLLAKELLRKNSPLMLAPNEFFERPKIAVIYYLPISKMMQNNILKIQAFQYECFSTISEESYLKFCEHLNLLATQAQQLRDDVFNIKKVNACCQTNGVSSIVSQIRKTQVQPPPKPSAPAAVAVAKERIFTLTADESDFKEDQHLSKRDVITCDYCELKFNSLIKMQQHVNIAHSEDFTSKFFPCQKCDLVFLSVDELSEHSVCAHEDSEDNKFEDDQLCPYCCEVKPSWVQYVAHLEMEHHVLVCKICHTFCSDSKSLEEHIKKSHMSGITKEEIRELVLPVQEPKPVNKVPFNKRPFDDLVGIKKRGRPKRTEVNTDAFTVLKCHFCNALFNSEDSLRKHIVYKHDTGELQCCECNLKFKRASAYENHMRLFHKKIKELKSSFSRSSQDKDPDNNQQQPLLQKLLLKSVKKEENKKLNLVRGQSKPSCEICGEMCNRAEDQEIHKDFHITRKPDRFLCLFCNEPAMPQKELKTHIMSEHRYRCPFCALTFWWKANLESHLKQLHRTKNCCILCGLQAEGDALRNHIIDMHMVKKAYLCKVCNAEHLTLKEMSEHERSHTRLGRQPPTCDFCNRSFGRKKSLQGHILRHIFGSFSCSLCGVQCKTPEELHLHLGEHQKSQFACMCGEYFQAKADLQMHQKNTPCKPFFNQPIHRADLFVEVCIEDRDEDIPAFPAPATVRIVESGEHQLEDIYQINIAETPAQVSRNFMRTLATANKANQLVLPRQPILILNTLDGAEATLIENKSTGIMSWVDNSDIADTDVIQNTD